MLVRQSVCALLLLASFAGCSSDEARASSSDVLAQESTAIDAGTTPAADAGATPAADAGAGLLSGSTAAAQCTYLSRSAPDSGMCNGYFCGVTEAQVAAAMPADSLCGNPADTCQGTLVDRVAACTRNIVIANLGTPAAQLRPQIEACVYSDEQIKATVASACLGCFLDSAGCVVDNCLMDCVVDGPACDSCRLRSNCIQPVFGCAKVPNPL